MAFGEFLSIAPTSNQVYFTKNFAPNDKKGNLLMFYFILLMIIAVSVISFYKLRNSQEKRYWTQQTFNERVLLSLTLASIIQFLYFPVLPGFVLTAMTLGKNSFYDTDLGNLIWSTSVIVFNIMLYLPIFYLLLYGLQVWFKGKENNIDAPVSMK
jgi:hypothetical protein